MTTPIQPRQRRATHLEIWRQYLTFGHDFFLSLPDIGLNERSLPHGAARAAWREYGAEIMRDFEPTEDRKRPWGFEKFGQP